MAETTPLGPLGRPTGPEGEHKQEDAAESQKYTRRETLAEEFIGAAETPQELFWGLRQLEKRLEDSRVSPDLSERYTPPREHSMMQDRAENMSHSVDEMIKKGWITGYNEDTGEAKPKDRRFGVLAISTEQIEKTDPVTGRFLGFETKYYFGTNESRALLERAYNKAWIELSARHILGEHVGLRLAIDIRDSLENLTAILHGGRMPKLKPDHLETLFNMPSVAELASNPENKQLGDRVEEALFLNLVMLNSGNKQRMLDFLARPGAKHLIAKLAKEKGTTYEDWEKQNIGKPKEWVEDNDRLLEDDHEKKLPASWRAEASDGRRGLLAQWSNISAWGGKPAEFSNRKELQFIEEIVGGLVGGGQEGIQASWVAAAIMRGTGTYASEGYVALPNGESLLPLGEGRFISGDDTGKLWAYMFNMKEGKKGRKSGLKGLIGKIPDMAMNLFDWAQIEMADLPKNWDGTYQKRSIWDAWLGTPGGKPKTDLLTGKKSTTEFTKEEGYHRLGDINFQSLEREFHGTFTIMQWLMGNGGKDGPTGVFIEAMKTEFRFEEDFSLEYLKKMWKYIGIALNPVTLTKGSTHLYTNPEKDTKVITKNYLRNLLLARIHSAAFSLGILNAKIKLFNPGAGGEDVGVPAAVLVKAFVEEALKDSPKNEDELIKHYIDENLTLRTLGKGETSGTPADMVALVEAKFEPQGATTKDKENMKYVGRVTGRKI